MAYKIRITKLALEDIAESANYYATQGSFAVSQRWLDGLDNGILDLEKMPRRCPFAPENEDLDFEARQFHYFSHRVIFTIEDDTIHILRVYHGARRPLTADDFDPSQRRDGGKMHPPPTGSVFDTSLYP